MTRFLPLVFMLLFACPVAGASPAPSTAATTPGKSPADFITVSADGSAFTFAGSADRFTPWGFNYDRDHKLRLLEDYWEREWKTVEQDLHEMKELGANVVRIHLQFGKFMRSPTEPNTDSLDRLRRLVLLAEKLGLYLDITGLGSYRKRDVPSWYDKLDEPARWEAQANFWRAIARALADRPGVFCYDLMNEPVVPGKAVDGWLHPFALAGFHYVQYVVLDPRGREADDVARQWTRKMTAAIREHDPRRLITIGMLPIKSDEAEAARGFVPVALKDELDFIAVHLYPESKRLDEAMETLKLFDVGKPLVIEEVFPLNASEKELGAFIEQSRSIADGWIGFYWGQTVEQLRDDPDIVDKVMLSWLELFQKLKPLAIPATAPSR